MVGMVVIFPICHVTNDFPPAAKRWDPAEVAEAICRRSRVGADLWQSVRLLPSSKVGPLELCTRQGGIQMAQVLTCEEPWMVLMGRDGYFCLFLFKLFGMDIKIH